MKYYRIEWIHNFKEQPVQYLIEVDLFGFEHKKIEKYKDGVINFASNELEKGKFLSQDSFDIEDYKYESSVEKICATEISQSKFYKEWDNVIKCNNSILDNK